jgi:hypothetical protein
VRRVERLEASFEQSEGVGAALRDTTALFAALLANGDAALLADGDAALFAALLANGDAALLSDHDAFLKTAVCVAHDHLTLRGLEERQDLQGEPALQGTSLTCIA